MKNTGILLTNECELAISVQRDTSGLITSGMLVGNTLYQNQYIILKAQKGELKENPTLGCGIDDLANDDDLNAWQKLIREEMDKDGMQVNKLTINESGMALEADYK